MNILDNPIPHPETVPYARLAARTGLFIALASIVLNLVYYVTGLYEDLAANTTLNWVNTFVTIGIFAGFLFYALKAHRDEDLSGYIELGRCTGYGALAGLVAGVISGVWTVLFIKFIAPDFLDAIKNGTMAKFEEQGMSEEQIEQAMQFSSWAFSPGFMAIAGAIGSAIFGLIAGVLVGLVVRRERPQM